MSASPYKQLEQEFKRLHAFRGALSLLRWDAAVMMPRGSADVRGEQLAALETEYHALLTAPHDHAAAGPRAGQSPGSGGLAAGQSARDAPPARSRHRHAGVADFASRAGHLARRSPLGSRRGGRAISSCSRRTWRRSCTWCATRRRCWDRRWACRRTTRWWMSSPPVSPRADIDAIFKALSRRLPSLIRETLALQAQRPPLPISGKFPPGKQRALVVEVMRAIGFPSIAAVSMRVSTPSPKGCRATSASPRVSITPMRFRGCSARMHETGHAMYDLGLPQAWRDQPVGRDRGMALEESQSLLLEMIVGRSRAFVQLPAAAAREALRCQRAGMGVENIYAASDPRAAQPDPRRCRRADLSAAHPAALRAGEAAAVRRLAVRDLPDAWNTGMEQRLGFARTAPPMAACRISTGRVGSFGYFPSYALGAVIAAQL